MKHKNLATFTTIIKSLFLIFISPSVIGQTNSNEMPAASAITEQHKMLARSNETLRGEATLWFSPCNLPRIGYLSGAGSMHFENFFMDELKQLGFKNGENVHIETRLGRANTDDFKIMAKELAGMDLQLIVAGSLPIALEIQKNNPKMPMVLITCPGMVSNGFAKSMEHPGGIYTGIDELPDGVTTKRLQLLHAAVPNAKRIVLLSATPGVGGHEIQLAEAEATAKALGIQTKLYRVKTLEELEQALKSLKADGIDGMLVFQGALTLANRQMVVDFAIKNQLPAIYQQSVFVELGGLMS